MELKRGYRQTEVGVIPEEWSTGNVSDHTRILSGGTPSTSSPDYWDGSIPWVAAGDVSRQAESRFIVETADHISQLGLARSPAQIVPGGTLIIIARGATAGRMAQLGKPMAFNQTCYGLLANHSIDQDFLYYVMRFTINSMEAQIYGTIFRTLTLASFKSWPIPLPPLPEQRAIAAALSDVDAQIAAFNALLAKQRALKQAVMQQLLTGRTRLPGFSVEWELRQLGRVASVIMGQSPSSQYYNQAGDGLPLIQGNADISERKSIVRNYTSQITRKCLRGDVLLSVRAPVGEVAKATFDACIGRGMCAIRSTNDFFYHYLIFCEPEWGRLSRGSTFDSVNSEEVRSFEMYIPLEDAEQTAITAVLSDMNAEIDALDARIAKTRLLKQAMMQELLTGRTRLV